MEPREKLVALREELSARFLEREEVIRGLLAALVAGEHVLLLGPVGTGKSMLASEVCARLRGASLFSWLLTRFSTPEELFGPISLKALEEDRYLRVTDHKLPQAHIAFLDEIFKANSAILNSLLALINERVFHNGDTPTRVPLVSLIGASNELPEEGELQALYDRFLLRFAVDYIQEDFRFLKMLTLEEAPPPQATVLTLEELEALRALLPQVELHEAWLGDLVALRSALKDKGTVISDRRWRKAAGLLRAWALVDGRMQVEEADMQRLVHVLWSQPEQQEELRLALAQVLRGHEDQGQALLAQAREVRDYALQRWPSDEMKMRASIEAHTKLNRLHQSLEALAEQARGRRRQTHSLERALEEISAMQKRLLAEGM